VLEMVYYQCREAGVYKLSNPVVSPTESAIAGRWTDVFGHVLVKKPQSIGYTPSESGLICP
jgi:hypothetical protein